MASSPEDTMEYDEDLGPISEECTTAINLVIPYQMFISAVYLFMACSYDEEKEMPNFVVFFEDQAEVRRYQAKRFLRYLRNRNSIICLPLIQMPDVDKWENDEQALTCALKVEIEFTKILEDLQTAASQAVDIHLLTFVEGYLIRQQRNITYLQRQISYQKQLEEMKEQEMREQQRREEQRREQQMREEQQMKELETKEQEREMTEQEMKEQEREMKEQEWEMKEQGMKEQGQKMKDQEQEMKGEEQEVKGKEQEMKGEGDEVKEKEMREQDEEQEKKEQDEEQVEEQEKKEQDEEQEKKEQDEELEKREQEKEMKEEEQEMKEKEQKMKEQQESLSENPAGALA